MCVCVALSIARVMARGKWASDKRNEKRNTRKHLAGEMGKRRRNRSMTYGEEGGEREEGKAGTPMHG